MINKVTLMGNIGRDPQFSLTQEGKELAQFPLATNSSWKDEAGEWQTHTEWHHIVVLRSSTIQWMKDVLKKGDRVYVEGKLTYHSSKDKYNQNRTRARILVLGADSKVQLIFSTHPKAFSHPANKDEPENSLPQEEVPSIPNLNSEKE